MQVGSGGTTRGVGVCEGQWAKNLSLRRWMRPGIGWMFRELCRWEVRIRLGWLPMTRRHLDRITWESRVVRRVCGAADRSGVSKNVSSK